MPHPSRQVSQDRNGRAVWKDVAAAGPAVLPSLLLCDFANLQDEVRRLESAGVRALHLDVMDGHFVPNFTYGLTIVEALRRVTDLPLDAHLMIERPERYVEAFVNAGADSVTIHVEATDDPADVLKQIHQAGAAAGIAINPATPLERIEPALPVANLVLVMSVMPGFGGQSFDPVALDKLIILRDTPNRVFQLQVDGGINVATIAQTAASGAELFVVGSAIFRANDYTATIEHLTNVASVS